MVECAACGQREETQTPYCDPCWEECKIVDEYLYEDGYVPGGNDPLRYIEFWLEFDGWRKSEERCKELGSILRKTGQEERS